jgi:uncharacterized protein (TIGR02453 family)
VTQPQLGPAHFGPGLLTFLSDLTTHNDRDWFKANRTRYDEEALEPALAFISAFAPHLRKISPHFQAIPKAQGGSLFRIHRDTRFAADKSPYKTHLGIHFRHKSGEDAFCPGFYLHLEPGASFAGLGLWHPPAPALNKIREAIAERPDEWSEVKKMLARQDLVLEGESLSRPPRGFAADHEHLIDLKRKDFVTSRRLLDQQVLSDALLTDFAQICEHGAPLARFICSALEEPF